MAQRWLQQIARVSESVGSHSQRELARGRRLLLEVDRVGEAVRQAGGVLVIGTGLHDARRIDAQRRGRAGRQGDPGTSCFRLSLDHPSYKKCGEVDHDRFHEAHELYQEMLQSLRQRLLAALLAAEV